jgi:hypothetical protein
MLRLGMPFYGILRVLTPYLSVHIYYKCASFYLISNMLIGLIFPLLTFGLPKSQVENVPGFETPLSTWSLCEGTRQYLSFDELIIDPNPVQRGKRAWIYRCLSYNHFFWNYFYWDLAGCSYNRSFEIQEHTSNLQRDAGFLWRKYSLPSISRTFVIP